MLVGLGILTPELFRKKKAHSSEQSDRESIQHSTSIKEKSPIPLKPHFETVLVESAERLLAGDFLLGKRAA